MTTYPESHKYGVALTQSMVPNTVKASSRQGGNLLTADSGFAPGTPYFEIYAASGPEAFSSKRNPTCANQGTAEHNAREYSRDGRSYVVEHINAEGKRSKVSEFRNGRKVRQASA